MAEPHVVTVHIEDDATFIALMEQWQRERRATRKMLEMWRMLWEAEEHTDADVREMEAAMTEYERIRSEDVGQH